MGFEGEEPEWELLLFQFGVVFEEEAMVLFEDIDARWRLRA